MKMLFVCTGNTCRSPMAQAVIQKRLDDIGEKDITVDSAGIFCGYGAPMSANTSQIVESMGIFFTHSSQPVTPKLIEESDMIVTMTREHKNILSAYVPPAKLFCIDDITHEGDISDPYGQDIEAYKKVFLQLTGCADRIIALAKFKMTSEPNGEDNAQQPAYGVGNKDKNDSQND